MQTLFADDQARATNDCWWLRSPGIFEDKAAKVEEGRVYLQYDHLRFPP